MIQITDEILNKYLDGELSSVQAEQVKFQLRSSEEFRRKFDTLKLVHDNLSTIQEDEVSVGFTENLMKQIVKRSTAPNQQIYFIASVVTFISILCLVIFGFSLSAIISATSSSIDEPKSVFDSVSNLSGGLVEALQQLFSGAGLSIIGSIFSIIVLISGYFFFEMQKRVKTNLGNGQHL